MQCRRALTVKMTLRQKQFGYKAHSFQGAAADDDDDERTEALRIACQGICRKNMLQSFRASMSCIYQDQMASATHLLRK